MVEGQSVARMNAFLIRGSIAAANAPGLSVVPAKAGIQSY